MKEQAIRSWPGIALLILNILLFLGSIGLFIAGAATLSLGMIITAIIFFAVTLVSFFGFYMVEPNQAAVLSLFGRYVGTVKESGLRFNNPFYTKKKISLRIRNFESGRLKVNDLEGSPIEIAAVIVWKVVDSAEAVFNVDDFESFVHIQSESALRAMASSYPYDQDDSDQVSLRSHPGEISQHIAEQLDERLSAAGIDVVEARISHLAYAAEIASSMLQRQQAKAVISARSQIVEGALGMVEMALTRLEKGELELDEERKASMASNLLVVLCSDQSTQPVINTGSLY